MAAGSAFRSTIATLLLACAAAGGARPAAAQLRTSGGIDLTYAPSYVWRGVTRSERLVLTPAVWGRLDPGANVLSAGAWSAWEPRGADPGTRTLRRPDSRGVAELDLWAQYTRRLLRTDVSLGAVRYLFFGDGEDDATEAYLQIWPDSDSLGLPVDLRGAVYVGVDGDRPAYAEVEASRSFSLVPLPSGPPSLLLGVTAGYALHAPADAPLARFGETGVTHALGAATLLVPAGRFTAHAGLRHLRGYDAATRTLPQGRESRHRTWGELGASLALGTQRKAK
jgi:hypothetical protein